MLISWRLEITTCPLIFQVKIAMTDVVSPAVRSKMMSGIGGKNTKPEMLVRKALFRRGFRYRLHDKRYPGRPDIVLPRYKAFILVHGCFWHGHGCHLFKWPSTRPEFWTEKITRNRERDAEQLAKHLANGFRVLTIWECALKGRPEPEQEQVFDMIVDWVKSGAKNSSIAADPTHLGIALKSDSEHYKR